QMTTEGDAEQQQDAEGSDDEEMLDEEAEGEEPQEPARPYLPNSGDPQPGPDEELVMDRTAYKLYYQMSVEWPCLSIDVLPDPENAASGAAFDFDDAERSLSCFLVCGTQAPEAGRNAVCVMRAAGLFPMRRRRAGEDGEDSDDDSEEDSDDEEADRRGDVSVAQLRHNRTVNRIRASDVTGRPLAATWSEAGAVYIFDLTEALTAVADHHLLTEFTRRPESPAPLFAFRGHSAEGFGLDWSRLVPGRLASGDCAGAIHVWQPAEGGAGWRVDPRPLAGHSGSVEDLQWSPTEASVLAGCSVDRSLRVFDVRAKPDKACMLTRPDCHGSDVNVIAWNRLESQYIVSGGDDCALRVWDLRRFASGAPPACELSYHKGPITSVQWHPTDSSVFLATSEDNQLTLWDLACEGVSTAGLPPQLLFIHMGQQEMKEGHWHPQLPGLVLSTALDGLNIFKTISI
ncbi:hypothetical protein BOX15_Mlig002290g1, partial [Macrostomum lignano]